MDLLYDSVIIPNYTHPTDINSVPIIVDIVCDNSEEDTNNKSLHSDYDSDVLAIFQRQRKFKVTGQLDRYKTLEKNITFKDLIKAKEVIAFYIVANKKGLKVDKSDKRRLRYMCDTGSL